MISSCVDSEMMAVTMIEMVRQVLDKAKTMGMHGSIPINASLEKCP